MGVHGLWELLLPVGCRVDSGNVSRKTVAVDISIWLTQFLSAMREADGAMLRNAHLLGVLRRCCKLLYLGVKPVFIFDGATPALKRRTVALRRSLRDKQAGKIRKIAEQLLLSRLKDDLLAGNGRKRKALRTVSRSSGQRSSGSAVQAPLAEVTPAGEGATRIAENGHEDRMANASGMDRFIEGAILAASPDEEDEAEITPEPRALRDVSATAPASFSALPHDLLGQEISDGEVESGGQEYGRIALPEDIHDIDDEELVNLPPHIQSEVFKQIKLQQRKLHREAVLEMQASPVNFSKAQIAGFLRNTALNRRISKVRTVINSQTGASRRIASDSTREYLLEEVDDDDDDDEYFGVVGHGRRLHVGPDDDAPNAAWGAESNGEVDVLKRMRLQNAAKGKGFALRRDVSLDTASSRRMRDEDAGVAWAGRALSNGGCYRLGANDSNAERMSYRSYRKRRDDPSICGGSHRNAYGLVSPSGDDDAEDEFEDDETFLDGKAMVGRGESTACDSEELKAIAPLADNVANKITASDSSDEDYEWEDGKEEVTLPWHLELDVCDAVPGGARRTLEGSVGDGSGRLSGPQFPVAGESQGPLEDHVVAAVPVGADEAGVCSDLNGTPKGQGGLLSPPRASTPSALANLPEDSGHLDNPRASSDVAKITRSSDEPNETINIQEDRSALRDDSTELRVLVMEGIECERIRSRECNAEVDANCRHRQVTDTSIRRPQEVDAVEARPAEDFLSSSAPQSPVQRTPDPHLAASRNGKHGANNCPRERNESSSLLLQPSRVLAASMEDMSRREDTVAASHGQPKEQTQVEDECRAPEGGTDRDCALSMHVTHSEVEVRTESTVSPVETNPLAREPTESLSDEMFGETRDLLRLLGLPYLEAPMEAEAQCAYLNASGVVDAVITEDSDAFLFGAKAVYRNLFMDGKFAESYDVSCIESELGIDRGHLIKLALLLGSDYTEGVRGVGIVNSMEILEAFPGEDGLKEFKEWVQGVTLLQDNEFSEEELQGSTAEAVQRRFCWKHRNMKRNWEIPNSFPNPAVADAYWHPEVDKSTSPFSWKSIDVEGLRVFCWDKFGWDLERFRQVMGPVLKQVQHLSQLDRGPRQSAIDDFFKPHRFAKIRSERLKLAIKGVAGDRSAALMAERSEGKQVTAGKKRRRWASMDEEPS